MNPWYTNFILFFLFSLLPHPTSSYIYNGFQVQDLSYAYPYFNYEAVVWKDIQSSTFPGAMLTCSSAGTAPYTYLVGGAATLSSGTNNVYSRTYTGLKSHKYIYYAFNIWVVDGWSGGTINIGFDSNTQTTGWILTASLFPAGVNQCGTNERDLSNFRVFGRVKHTGSTLTFKLISDSNTATGTATMGIRNLDLLFATNPTGVTEDVCGIVTVTGVYALTTNSCPASEGSYLPIATSPQLPCDLNCASCFGASAKECYSCAATSRFNGTHCVSCSLAAQSIPDSDGVCKNCQEFVIKYDKTAKKGHYFQLYLLPEPCDLNEHEVRLNLVISAGDADFPEFSYLVIKLDDNLYQIELIMEKDLVKETDLAVSLYYLTGYMTVPRTFRETSLVQALKKATLPVQITFMIIIAISLVGALALKNTEMLWHIIGYMQFVQYLQYINIICPPQVYALTSYFGFSFWSLIPGISNSAEDAPAVHDLADYAKDYQIAKWAAPQQFKNQDVESFFLDNGFVNFLISILILILLGVILLLRNSPSFATSPTVIYLKVNLRWKIIIRVFLYSCVPLSLAIFLQFRVMSFSSGYLAASSIFAIMALIYMLVMIIFIVRILYNRPANLLSMQVIINIYGSLYKGLEFNEKGTGKYYYVLIMARGIFLTIFVALAESIPLVQIVGVLYLNIAVIIYLLKKARFANKKVNIIIRANEFLMLVIQLCMLCLHFEVNSIVFYQFFGWTMAILVILGFSGPFIYHMGVQIFYIDKVSKMAIKYFKTKRMPRSQVQTLGGHLQKTAPGDLNIRNQDKTKLMVSETNTSYNLNDNSMFAMKNDSSMMMDMRTDSNNSMMIDQNPMMLNNMKNDQNSMIRNDNNNSIMRNENNPRIRNNNNSMMRNDNNPSIGRNNTLMVESRNNNNTLMVPGNNNSIRRSNTSMRSENSMMDSRNNNSPIIPTNDNLMRNNNSLMVPRNNNSIRRSDTSMRNDNSMNDNNSMMMGARNNNNNLMVPRSDNSMMRNNNPPMVDPRNNNNTLMVPRNDNSMGMR